jgi:hypothetical protein
MLQPCSAAPALHKPKSFVLPYGGVTQEGGRRIPPASLQGECYRGGGYWAGGVRGPHQEPLTVSIGAWSDTPANNTTRLPFSSAFTLVTLGSGDLQLQLHPWDASPAFQYVPLTVGVCLVHSIRTSS